jgi:hypothetical protein
MQNRSTDSDTRALPPAVLSNALNTVERLIQLVRLETHREPKDGCVKLDMVEIVPREGNLDLAVVPDKAITEARDGCAMIILFEFRSAVEEAAAALKAAFDCCGQKKALIDAFGFVLHLKTSNKELWGIEEKYPRGDWSGFNAGVAVPASIDGAERACEYLRSEIERLNTGTTIAGGGKGKAARSSGRGAGPKRKQRKRTKPTKLAKGTADTVPSIEGYEPADTLWQDQGILQPRLSEAKKDGRVRYKLAPSGMKDSQGRPVRVLYNRQDAIKHCSPKRVTEETRRKLGLGNS